MHHSTWTGLEYRNASDEPVSVVPDLAEKMEAAARDPLPAAIASSRTDARIAAAFQRLIEGDEAARAAIAEAGRPSLPELRPFDPRLVKAARITLTVGPCTDFRYPPYDWSWNWGPGHPSMQASGDPATGEYQISGSVGTYGGGPSETKGASGLAVTLRSPGTAAVVEVRPYVTYEYSWDASCGGGLVAASAGALDLSAWRGNQIVTPVTYAWLWNARVGLHQSAHGSDGGTAWPPDYRVTVNMDADVEYVVNIGAFVSCEAAGVSLAPSITGLSGDASAMGRINANLRWVTVQRL